MAVVDVAGAMNQAQGLNGPSRSEMPAMDGYETMREIRRSAQLRTLPIVALTAKAMKGDREKCLEAGASDYIAKPVNTDELVSLLRVWLHR